MAEALNSDDLYPRGSAWRRWDLHIHTPKSIYSKYGVDSAEVWEKFITDLSNLSPDFTVLGINDYLFLDGYEHLKDLQKTDKRLQRFRFLPVVEFRIEKFAGVQFGPLRRINLHVIFSDELEVVTIRSQFLNTLEQSYKIDDGQPWTRSIDRKSVEELGKKIKANIPKEELQKYQDDLTEGFNNLSLPDEKIYQSLKKDCFVGKHLIAVGKTEWADLKWTDASIATKKTILNSADIVFTAAASIEEYNNAKKKLFDQQVNDILLDCSDAHNYSGSSDKDRIGNCFNWIKADPTFEGLKQVIFEPNERLRVQVENPSLDFAKPYFSSISIRSNRQIFADEPDPRFAERPLPLPLNQNLVAIIGGRGEGKSILTDYISSSFAGQVSSKNESYHKSGEVVVEYQKTNQTSEESVLFTLDNTIHSVDFLYIGQGRLKNIVEQRERKSSIAESIRKLAKLEQPKFSGILETSATAAIATIFEVDAFLGQQDDTGRYINNLEYLQNQERSFLSFIENITTKENQDKLSRYSHNLAAVINLTAEKENANQFLQYLKETNEQINQRIVALNTRDARIQLLDPKVFSPQTTATEKWMARLDQSLDEVEGAISEVRDEFKDYRGDLATLLADVGKFQESLFAIRERIQLTREKLAKREETIKNLFEEKPDSPSIVSQIQKEYERQKCILETEWLEFNKVDQRTDLNNAQKGIMKQLLSDLSIEVVIDFDVDRFYENISDAINGSVWRSKNNRRAQEERFGIVNLATFFDFLHRRFLDFCYDNAFYQESFWPLFLSETKRSDFIHVIPTLLYKGKNLEKISVGQKGTVYLKMVLATEAFSKPIIFDQPEDDLDNEFIMSELIDLFKDLKKYRQVIIVTHNANLVVNADADQVIVAKNQGGELTYTSGSLEDSSINMAICRILEGGTHAFEKRRDKYRYLKKGVS